MAVALDIGQVFGTECIWKSGLELAPCHLRGRAVGVMSIEFERRARWSLHTTLRVGRNGVGVDLFDRVEFGLRRSRRARGFAHCHIHLHGVMGRIDFPGGAEIDNRLQVCHSIAQLHRSYDGVSEPERCCSELRNTGFRERGRKALEGVSMVAMG